MNEKEFIEEVSKLGIKIDDNQLILLNKYYEILIEKNKIINLTNITIKEDVYLKHFYDSLTISLVCDLEKCQTLCDVGTGAGFPGLVLKIVFPHLKVTLIDSLGKRINFLNEVIKELDLMGVEAIHTRVEDYAKNKRSCFDLVTSRAVAKLAILTELCLPLTKINGYFISMKGKIDEELVGIENNLKVLGSDVEEIKTFILPFENSNRTLIKIKKKVEIDKKYPRNFKEIKKKPL